jgi:hypothetical protein
LLANRPDTTRVAGEVARELAYRAASRTYVSGRVDRVMSGYSIIINVHNADDDRVVISVNGLAQNQDALISTLDQLSLELRERLGEARDKVHATRPSKEVFTPSFEAYQLYVRARDLTGEGDFESSKTETGH